MAEVLLRLTGLAHPGGIATMTEGQFRRLPGIYAPNQHVVSRDVPALPHEVSTDSLGFRGVNFARSKPAGEFRVLFAGDSFTYGSYVDDSVTVPQLVEEQLRPLCRNVRVINAGLGGSTITDQVKVIARAMPLDPDAVVVMFSENDIVDLRNTPMWDRLEANRKRKSRFPASIVYTGLRRTALWNLVLRARARRANAPSSVAGPGDAMAEGTERDALRVEYAAALSALRDTLAAQHVRLVFAAMPTHLTVRGLQSGEQYQWALAIADSLLLPHPDILAAMHRAGRPESLYLLPHDGHTSAAGNHIAAEQIAGEILRAAAPIRPCGASQPTAIP